jgi:YesN/AraC family two-component response regulator
VLGSHLHFQAEIPRGIRGPAIPVFCPADRSGAGAAGVQLQREQYARLLSLAAAESASNPISAVLEYVRGHLSEPLTVADMADLVRLSPSAAGRARRR